MILTISYLYINYALIILFLLSFMLICFMLRILSREIDFYRVSMLEVCTRWPLVFFCLSTAHVSFTQLSPSDWHSKLGHPFLRLGAKVVRSNDLPLNKTSSIGFNCESWKLQNLINFLFFTKMWEVTTILIFFLICWHLLVMINVTSCH